MNASEKSKGIEYVQSRINIVNTHSGSTMGLGQNGINQYLLNLIKVLNDEIEQLKEQPSKATTLDKLQREVNDPSFLKLQRDEKVSQLCDFNKRILEELENLQSDINDLR